SGAKFKRIWCSFQVLPCNGEIPRLVVNLYSVIVALNSLGNRATNQDVQSLLRRAVFGVAIQALNDCLGLLRNGSISRDAVVQVHTDNAALLGKDKAQTAATIAAVSCAGLFICTPS